jgi:hypothetical protein
MPQAFAPCGQRGQNFDPPTPDFQRLIQTAMRGESDVLFRPRNNEAVAVQRQFRRNLWGSCPWIVFDPRPVGIPEVAGNVVGGAAEPGEQRAARQEHKRYQIDE